MDQQVLFHFMVKKNDRFFQFIVPPGTQWDEIQSALDEFKSGMVLLEQDAKAKEAASTCKEE